MVIARVGSILTLGASIALSGMPVQAQSPELYYAWRSIEGGVATCLDRSTTALNAQNLSNVQVEGNSVAATTDAATAVFVCLANSVSDTTVMLMVSSNDDDLAFQLRETLKETF